MGVKVALNVKNGSKVFKPSAGDVIIFDGKDWYVTTKHDIFREYEEKVDAKLKEITEQMKRNDEDIVNFKKDISEQMISMSETIKEFVLLQQRNEGEKWLWKKEDLLYLV